MSMAYDFGEYKNQTLANGRASYQRVEIANMDVPATGDGEADLHTDDVIDCRGADLITVWFQNNDGALDLDAYVYVTGLESPTTGSHVAKEWELIPYSAAQNQIDVDAGKMVHVTIQGPVTGMKLRGVSESDAFTGDIDAVIEMIYKK